MKDRVAQECKSFTAIFTSESLQPVWGKPIGYVIG